MVSLGRPEEDQAAGLRRLFARRHARIVLVAGARGGAEQAAVAVGIARELAAERQRVVIIDEQAAPDNAAGALGLAVRFDLLQALNADARPAQVVLHAEEGIRLLPAARLARQTEALEPRQRHALSQMLRGVQKGADFILVNASAQRSLTPLALAARYGVIAAAAGSSAATEGYRLIKQIRQSAPAMRIGLLASRAEEGDVAACANLIEVARAHLAVDAELFAGAGRRHAMPALVGALLRWCRNDGAPSAQCESAPRGHRERPACLNPVVY